MLLNSIKSSKTHKRYNKHGSIQNHSQLKINMSEKCYNQHKLQVTKNSNREMLNEFVEYNLSMLTKKRIKPEIVDLLLFPVNVANKGTIQRL